MFGRPRPRNEAEKKAKSLALFADDLLNALPAQSSRTPNVVIGLASIASMQDRCAEFLPRLVEISGGSSDPS